MAFIHEENIFLNEEFSTQDEIFHFLSDKTVELGFSTSKEAVYQKLTEREAEGTTGMMDGFAIPHAKAEEIKESQVVIVRLKNSIDWQSMDGNPTSFVIALFIPEEESGTTHLKLLSQVARLLMRSEVTSALKAAETESAIAQLLNQKIKEV